MHPGCNLYYVHSNWAGLPLGGIERTLRQTPEPFPSVRVVSTLSWFDYETFFLLQRGLYGRTDWLRKEPYRQRWLQRVNTFN